MYSGSVDIFFCLRKLKNRKFKDESFDLRAIDLRKSKDILSLMISNSMREGFQDIYTWTER
jgi:hypothetical protein